MRNGILRPTLILFVTLFSISHLASAGTKKYPFPPDFKWCVATAAHQIEGGNTASDWWAFEHRDPVCDSSGCKCTVKNCETSGVAVDHWNRLEEDTSLLKELNMKAYRFSVEWAKIEPTEGHWDQDAIKHYQKEIALLAQNGIEPIITLQHFTLPKWFADKGGWAWSEAPHAFQRFTELVYINIAPLARDWVTINEPMIHLGGGYVMGLTPPGLQPTGAKAEPTYASGCSRDATEGTATVAGTTPADMQRMVAPLRGLLKSHAKAYHMLHYLARKRGREVRVGMAHHLRIFEPRVVINPLDWIVSAVSANYFNWAIPNALETGKISLNIPFVFNYDERIPELTRTQDFVGVNYYTRDIVWFILNKGASVGMCTKDTKARSDMGWEIYPNGFYRILREVDSRYPRRPVLVTENGLADKNDINRTAFIREHLKALHTAIRKGVRVESYCHWSLLDNYEWVEGFGPRFGLYEVDYQNNFQRHLRASGRYYSEVARQNGFEVRE